MSLPSGVPGLDRMGVLHQAAPTFLALLDDDDGVGVVSFDTDATPRSAVATAGSLGSGGGRDSANAAVNAHATNLAGMTAIGDGIEAAHNQLLAAPPGFDSRAILVFTDGEETEHKYISEVTSLIDERVYAVGLGTPDQLSPTGLSAITHGTGGYLTLTGPLGTDGVMRLAKYFSQMLAGVTNAQIVTDPTGFAAPALVEKVPFALTEADRRCDAILLTEAPFATTLTVIAPDGTKVTGAPDATELDAPAMRCLRMPLPLVSDPAAHGGMWTAEIGIDRAGFKRYLARLEERKDIAGIQRIRAHGIPYTLTVHAVSDLRMEVTALQNGHEPGSAVELVARLTEAGIPVAPQTAVRVRVTLPDGSIQTIPLKLDEPGTYRASIPSPSSGTTRCSSAPAARPSAASRSHARSCAAPRRGPTDRPRPRRPTTRAAGANSSSACCRTTAPDARSRSAASTSTACATASSASASADSRPGEIARRARRVRASDPKSVRGSWDRIQPLGRRRSRRVAFRGTASDLGRQARHAAPSHAGHAEPPSSGASDAMST
jgi:hypothetical protein